MPLDRYGQLEIPAPLRSRRQFLGSSVGAILALAMAGQKRARGKSVTSPATNEHSIIVLWMRGGQSHIDSFDPKTGVEEAGPFGKIQTRIPGLHFTDRLPKLAAVADELTVIRSIVGEETEHNRAQYFANTGFRPLASLSSPGIGSIVSHELGPVPMKRADRSGLASYISIGEDAWSGPGYLGMQHSAFLIFDPNHRPQNFGSAEEANSDRFQRRVDLLRRFDAANKITATHSLSKERQSARDQAIAMMKSPQQSAFDISQAPATLRERYGNKKFGQGCLMARQLVQAGVRFVEVHLDGWDSHVENFKTHDRLLAELDAGFSTLLTDLKAHGLLEQTLILCMGEFGRTPRINPRAGRDHHAKCWSAVLAGGCVKTGQVYGSTNARGSNVDKDPVKIPDLLATIFTAVGIDPHKQFTDDGGKPVELVDKGSPVAALL